MKAIRKQIKEHNFYKVYLLTGNEEYLLMQAKQLLRDAMVQPGDEMNYRLYEEKKVDLNEIRDLANTYPFFSEKRVLILDRTGILKDGKDDFVSILDSLPDTTCIIICEPEIDKRSKVYKWINKNGYVAEFLKKDQSEKILMQWVGAMLKLEKKQITASDAQYFLSRVGDDMFQIKSEMEKLISYVGEASVVTREDIDAITTGEVQNKIFDLMDAIGQGDKKKALKYYDDLLLLKEPPLRILYLMVRHFKILLSFADMRSLRKSDDEIAASTGVRKFFLRKYDQQIRRYHKGELPAHVETCVKVEHDIKSGRIGDQLGVETAIVELCGIADNGNRNHQ